MALRANRMRRKTDRVEDWAAWILLAGGLLVVVFSWAVGVRIHDQLVERSRVEGLERTPAVARLLAASPTIPSIYATNNPVMVAASWQDRSGAGQTGTVTAPQGLRAGGTVGIWIDRSGAVVPAPTSAGDALPAVVVAAGIVLGAGVSVLVCLWALMRWAILACNCARWEREWRQVSPVWTRGEGMRG